MTDIQSDNNFGQGFAQPLTTSGIPRARNLIIVQADEKIQAFCPIHARYLDSWEMQCCKCLEDLS